MHDTVLRFQAVRWGEIKLPELWEHQAEALDAWLNQGSGLVVLPTGAGKTEVALAIMARTAISTLILAPVRDLMYQWHQRILRGLKL